MPNDALDVNAGALTDTTTDNIEPVSHTRLDEKHTVVDSDHDDFNDIELDGNKPTEEELHGPNALRRVSAPIPWAAYTVAFVELCERFSYYGTTIVCKFCPIRDISIYQHS